MCVFLLPWALAMLERGPAHMFRIKPVSVRKAQQREKANNIFYIILPQQKLLQFFSVRGFFNFFFFLQNAYPKLAEQKK